MQPDRNFPVVDETEPEEAPSTIAVLRLGTLGDAVLTTPLYTALKRLYPDSRLTVIASEWNAVIPRHHESVDDVIPVPSGLAGLPALLRMFARRRFELYIDPKDHKSTTSRVIAELLRADRKVVSMPNRPILSGADIVPPAAGEHFTERSLAPMTVLAPEAEFDTAPSVSIPEPERTSARESIAAVLLTPYVVVNVSTGSPTRRWPEEKWASFLSRLSWEGGIAVISTPDDSGKARRVARASGNAVHLPTRSLVSAAALVESAYALITSDTSIVHIASALNVPTVALYFYAPRMMRMFSPRSDIHRVVLAPEDDPVSVVDVDDVLDAVRETLDRVAKR